MIIGIVRIHVQKIVSAPAKSALHIPKKTQRTNQRTAFLNGQRIKRRILNKGYILKQKVRLKSFPKYILENMEPRMTFLAIILALYGLVFSVSCQFPFELFFHNPENKSYKDEARILLHRVDCMTFLELLLGRMKRISQ